MKNLNLLKAAKKRIPIVTWLPKYSSDDALGDLVAGLTIGLTLIPQVIFISACVIVNSINVLFFF